MLRPNPRQVSQAPTGELKLKVEGAGIACRRCRSPGSGAASRIAKAAPRRARPRRAADTRRGGPRADLEGAFDGVACTRRIHRAPTKTVLDHLQNVAELSVNARVALRGEQLLDLGSREIRRDAHREREREGRIAVPAREHAQRFADARRRVAPDRLAAALAMQNRGAREQELQVIVELGHGADRRARGAHGIRLVDGDRGRNPLDAVDRGLVHAIQELACVRREGLDVTALPLGIQRVEHQRRLPGTAHPGHDDQLVEGEVQVEILEIVLTRATDADGIRARRIERWH